MKRGLVVVIVLAAIGMAVPDGRLAARAAPADSSPDACDHTATGVRLHVEIDDVRSATGTVTVVLYGNNRKDFLTKGKRINRIRIPANGRVVRGCMVAPTPGQYAIAFYHDENSDRHFDRTFIGLPEEGYGFSNDASAMMGLPAFRDVLFSAADGDTTLKMKMRY